MEASVLSQGRHNAGEGAETGQAQEKQGLPGLQSPEKWEEQRATEPEDGLPVREQRAPGLGWSPCGHPASSKRGHGNIRLAQTTLAMD